MYSTDIYGIQVLHLSLYWTGRKLVCISQYGAYQSKFKTMVLILYFKLKGQAVHDGPVVSLLKYVGKCCIEKNHVQFSDGSSFCIEAGWAHLNCDS